jgi:hypothetical protein
MMEVNMNDFSNWKEVTRGLYRYVVAPKVCYEIHLLYHEEGTNIMTARASLYIAGDWKSFEKSFFERERILIDEPVLNCLYAAAEDYKNNMG